MCRDDLPGGHLWNSSIGVPSKVIISDWCCLCSAARPGYIDPRDLEKVGEVPRKYTRIPSLQRFMETTSRDSDSGCLLWTGGTNDKGYPHFNFHDGSGTWTGMGAHRWIFREKFGYLPEVVMHRCDTPACVDWERCLIPGTHAENMADMIRKGRDSHSGAQFRLQPVEVRDIRKRRASGETVKQLADAYGVSLNCISGVVNGHTYRDVA